MPAVILLWRHFLPREQVFAATKKPPVTGRHVFALPESYRDCLFVIEQ
jgi:hypothetical protein